MPHTCLRRWILILLHLLTNGCSLHFLNSSNLENSLVHRSQLTRPDWLPLHNRYKLQERDSGVYLGQSRSHQANFTLALQQARQAAYNYLEQHLKRRTLRQAPHTPWPQNLKQHIQENMTLHSFYYESRGNPFLPKDRVYDVFLLWYLPAKASKQNANPSLKDKVSSRTL